MASSYERKFVFLEPQDKGFEGTAGGAPKGHIEIERRGRGLSLRLFVENLKEMTYQVQCLTKEGRMAVVGELVVPSNGKCQEEFKGDGENLMDSGLAWEAFQVIAIRPQGGSQTALAAWIKGTKGLIPIPLVERKGEGIEPQPEYQEQVQGKIPMGFKAPSEIPEEGDAEPSEDEKAPEQTLEKPGLEEQGEPKEGVEEAPIEVEVEGEDEDEEVEVEAEDEGDREVSGESEQVQGDGKGLEDQGLYREKYQGLEEELSKGYWVDFGGDYPEERIYQEEDTKADLTAPYYYINEYMDGFKELVQECQPFDPPLPNHTWWRIPKDQKELERFYLYYNDSFVHLTYPYMEYKNYGENYIQEYDELIFGWAVGRGAKNKLGYFVYGIPGRFCIQEQPFQGTTGFLYWHPLAGHQREKGAMGYWLLYIDAQTGEVAFPKKPIIPPVCRD